MGRLENRSRNSKGQLLGWGYSIRYEGKNYTKPKYLIGDKWVNLNQVPERKEYVKSEKYYFKNVFQKMRTRHKEHKRWSGEFEFEDTKNLLNHWHKQKEKYGDKCPITKQPLTMTSYTQGTGNLIHTNISPDRLFSPITYTKQNVLFTCVGWNLSKGDKKFHQLPIYFKKELLDRFYKILHERFPELEDIGWEAVDGHE